MMMYVCRSYRIVMVISACCSVMTMLIHDETCVVLMIFDLLVYYDDSVRTVILYVEHACEQYSVVLIRISACTYVMKCDSCHLRSVVVSICHFHTQRHILSD